MVFISRAVILAVVAFATVIGIIAIKYPGAKHIVFWLVLFSWAGLGASFGPTILLALFWEKTTGWGVLAGLVSGALTTVLWKSIPGLTGIAYELLPAFGVSLTLTFVVSLLTKPPEGAAEELDDIKAKY